MKNILSLTRKELISVSSVVAKFMVKRIIKDV